MMKKQGYIFRKVFVFIITVMIAAESIGNCTVYSVQAEDITDELIGEYAAETEGLEEEGTATGEAETEETETEEIAAEDAVTEEAATEDTGTEEIAAEENTEEEPFSEEKEFEFDELPGNDELLSEYLDQLFSENENRAISPLGIVGEKKLTNENDKKIYKELKASIEKIADGTRTSAVIEVNGLSMNIPVWESSVRKVMLYLLMDCPYDLYWFDKNSAYVSAGGSGRTVRTVIFSFTVAEEYRGRNLYTTNSAKMGAARKAVSNAKAIVKKHAAESDREKLESYRKEICNLVSYNMGAAYGNSAYGNPWQLIWVFDKNPDTNVVCEGYAKAFQYLCDLSAFKNNTVCYTVTGIMGDGRNSGPHMWNIVTLNGVNYMADVTNCDSGGVGSDGSLFLAVPKSGNVNSGYIFSNTKGRSVTYIYNSESKELLGAEILKLAGTSKNNAAASVTLSLNGQKLKNNTTLKATFNKKYTFKAEVTDKAGKTLKGGNAKITWSASNKKIATVNSGGKVSVKKKAGTVTITAKTADGKTAKVKLKVSKAVVKVTKLKITGTKTMSLKKKKTQTLKAAVTPASAANQKVTWKSSNKKIAVVNSRGKVTAKKAGTVKITATAKDGSKKKATITIRIKKK